MIATFTIEYTSFPQHNKRVESHHAGDAVEAEDFLMQLLSIGARISGILHEGVKLDDTQCDRMCRVAAERLAARLLSTSLGLDYAAVKHRFGFSA